MKHEHIFELIENQRYKCKCGKEIMNQIKVIKLMGLSWR